MNRKDITILQVNILANSGSTGKIAEGIGQAIISNGWRSIIAYGQKANVSKSETIRIGNNISIREHGLESRLFDNQGLASRIATRNFLKKLEDIRPTIIHLHNIHGYYLNYPLLFQYLASNNIPIVWTLHDCWPFTGHCAYFDYAKCDRWKTACHTPCPCKGNYPKSILADFSERNYSLKKKYFTSVSNINFVPVSYWLGDLLAQSFFSNYPIEVIHNGIDLDIFKPYNDKNVVLEKYNLLGKIIVLGVASEWDERKGMRDFFKLREMLPTTYSIVLVGVNGRQQKSLPDGIVGLCRTHNQQELSQLYSCADIFLNLTYEDNYPTTNLEAIACGTPVLTYNTGGSPESVSPNTGWVVEKGDVDSVAQIVKSQIQLKEEDRCKQRYLCREKALKEFEKGIRFHDYIKLYERILSK